MGAGRACDERIGNQRFSPWEENPARSSGRLRTWPEAAAAATMAMDAIRGDYHSDFTHARLFGCRDEQIAL